VAGAQAPGGMVTQEGGSSNISGSAGRNFRGGLRVGDHGACGAIESNEWRNPMKPIRRGFAQRATLVFAMLAATSMMFVAFPLTAFSQDAGQHLRAFIERLNEGTAKGDFDYAVSLQADDGMRVHPHAGVIKGRKALGAYFASVAKDWADATETITWMVADDSHAAAAITWSATERKSGKHIKMPMAFIADFDSAGKIKWSQIWFDFGAAMKLAE
jgi:SnoaL-like domain